MKNIGWLLVFVCKLSFAQNKDIKGLIEYVQQDSSEIIANIIIPSFEAGVDTIPIITIEQNNVAWLELRYTYRNTTSLCSIGIYDELYWKEMKMEPVFSENVCSGAIDDNYCYIIITNKKSYMIRFRVGESVRSYRLIIK
ncbi:hypothetical protein BH10BAC1_BH10BAC1_04850 [soil metagenome]